MVPEVKAEWLSDLRSGKYKKGRGVLKNRLIDGTFEHCCLGVLCEQAVRKGIIPPPTAEYGDQRFAGNAYTLPYQVMQWAGIDSDNPRVSLQLDNERYALEVRLASLSTLNDTESRDYSFAEIADIIEKYL